MAYRDTVLADSPIEYWELNETSGTNAVSTGSGAHAATHQGGVIVGAAGIATKGVTYDGVDDVTITPTTVTDFMAGTNFTVELWVKYDGTYTNDYPTFFRRDGSSHTFLIRTRNPSQTRGHIIETYFNGRTIDTGSTTFNDNNWHHVVVEKASTTLRLWVDNVEYTNGSGTLAAGGSGATSANIGRGLGAGEYFKGSIDEVAVYTTALTTTRISAHYNAAFVAGGYTAQAMTASATMPDAIVASNVRYITEDTGTDITNPNSNLGSLASYGSNGPVLIGLPSAPLGVGETIFNATLHVYDSTGDTNNSVDVSRITSAWSESTVTYNTRPSATLLGSQAIASGVGWKQIDVTGVLTATNYGVQLTGLDSSLLSSENTDATKRPYVVYTTGVVTNANPTSTPMTASGTMPDPVVSTTIGVSASGQPITASVSMPDANVVAEQFISVAPVADVITADATMPAGSGYSVSTEAVAGVMTASGMVNNATIALTQGVNQLAPTMNANSVFVKPSSVNGVVLETQEADDIYFQKVYADTPKHWFRLNDKGSIAKDRMGGPDGVYHGVQMGQFDAPDGRASVHFDGNASIEQTEVDPDETLNITNVIQSTLEFSFRTTKTNTFLLAGKDSVATSTNTTANPAREVTLKNGKISYKTYYYNDSLGHAVDPTEFSGFKNLADGQWHSVVIRGGTYRFAEYGVEIWVDGKLEVRRVSANALSGFPDWIGSRPADIDGYALPALPSSQNFVGDMSEVIFYPNLNVNEDEITKHYYAFMGWRPIEAQPIEAYAGLQDANAKGNQKRALYLWWSPETDAYNVGGGSFDNKMNMDPLLGHAKGDVNGVYDYEGYKVFTRGVAQGPGYVYRNEVTDAPSLIDLTRDVNLEDYDMVMFGDWPDEGSEIDYWNTFEPGGIERIVNQLLDANRDLGINIAVFQPRLAVDLGIVDRVELVPTLEENKYVGGQGAAAGLYDYGSAYDFPWNIAGSEGLVSANVIGSTFNGQAVNRDPAFLAQKAYFYGDTHKNDRFRIRALVDGLTDLPSYMIDKAVYHSEYDYYGWSDVAYKYLHRLNGLQIGDEFIFHGTDLGMDYTAISADYSDARTGRWFGTYATPAGHVKAGLVVTTFGDKLWQGQAQIDNPYKDYATTIAVKPGTSLNGRVLGGKIFVNFSEQPNRHKNVAVVQVIPEGETGWPYGYSVETPEQRTWDFSFTRKSLNSTQSTSVTSITVTGPTGEPVTVNIDSGAGSSLAMVRSSNIFPLEVYPQFDMVQRGLNWLKTNEVVEPGTVKIEAEPLEASAATPNAVAVAQHDVHVNIESMLANEIMPKVAEDQSGDVQIVTFPATASVTWGGYGKVIAASPMVATAELPEPDEVYASGEQIVLTLYGYDVTLFIKEED